MKKLNLLGLILMIGVLPTFVNCGGKTDSDPEAVVQFRKLKVTWEVTSVDLDGKAISEYVDSKFALTISGTEGAATFNYSVAGLPESRGASSWWPSGTLSFGTNVTNQLIRDVGNADKELNMTYSLSSNGTVLTINYNFAGDGHTIGRLSAVKGNWAFVFNKKS